MSTKPQHPLAQLGQLTHVSTGSSLQHHHQQSKEHDPVQSAQLLNQHIHHETAGHSEMFYGHHPDPAFHLMQQPTNLPIIAAATAQKEQHQWISEFQQEQLQPQPPQERVWSAGSSSSSTQSYPIGYPISRLHSVNNDILLRSGHQVSMLPQQWDQDFLQELDRKWTDEFSHNETVRENLMKSAPTADWDQMFSTVEASKIEANESRQQESLDKALEETWKSLDSVDLNDIAVNKEPSDDLTVNAAPISDELDFADWDDEYGSALASSIQSPSQQQKQMDFKEYQFESDNRHKDQPDPFAEGMRLLEAGGSLTEAALAFEAAVQLDPRHANAWAMLGKVQAENEKEEPAISALQHAIRENPQHLDALMALAVSYTNEGYDQQAFRMLNKWMAVRYPEIHSQHAPSDRLMDDESVPVYELYDSVSAQLLQAARTQPEIDADVQVALGVLFYNAGQYDKAVDCFDTAVKVRPNDYLLWNRLGATLANSGRSEEAISAYYHALDIKPSFVRGRYNLGVSCMNIGCYKEAAEHFLTALLMHQAPPDSQYASSQATIKHSNESSNLWETLRRTFILMERPDLSEMAIVGADLERFRKEFDF